MTPMARATWPPPKLRSSWTACGQPPTLAEGATEAIGSTQKLTIFMVGNMNIYILRSRSPLHGWSDILSVWFAGMTGWFLTFGDSIISCSVRPGPPPRLTPSSEVVRSPSNNSGISWWLQSRAVRPPASHNRRNGQTVPTAPTAETCQKSHPETGSRKALLEFHWNFIMHEFHIGMNQVT